jgi:hypothetical protein
MVVGGGGHCLCGCLRHLVVDAGDGMQIWQVTADIWIGGFGLLTWGGLPVSLVGEGGVGQGSNNLM